MFNKSSPNVTPTGKPKDISVFTEIRKISARSVVQVLGVMAVTWTLVSAVGIHQLLSDRRQFFTSLVSSHQEAIVSGQFRSFLEGVERDSSNIFRDVKICWKSVTDSECALPSLTGISVPLAVGSEPIAWVNAKIDIGPAIRLSLIALVALALTGFTGYLSLTRLRKRSATIQNSLSQLVFTLLSEKSPPPESALPAEIRPIAEALAKAVSELRTTHERNAGQKASEQMAQQVAHDIRSPLAALDMITSELATLPEEKRLIIRSAVGRIKDIANGLMQKNRPPPPQVTTSTDLSTESSTTVLLPALIDGLVTEKRMQYRSKIGVEIDFELGTIGYGVFVNVQPTELKRVLSNLINNSIEAFTNSGKVTVNLEGTTQNARLTIKDNGKGIPANILPKLMQRGETHGKEGGSGLGLYHASKSCQNWNGTLSVKSEVSVGTEITIILPRASAPHWFVPKLAIEANSALVILDDDTSIHQIWKGRFETLKTKGKAFSTHHFSTPQEVEEWMANEFSQTTQTTFLFDYELLGANTNGLALIEKLGISNQSILVTSRYEEQKIRETCKRLGVKLIPKGMAGFVPIEIQEAKTYCDAILIDDDELVQMSWQLAAKNSSKAVQLFSNADDFFLIAMTFALDSPVYVDSNLGSGVKGEQVSKRISDLGFKKVYLATGYESDTFSPMPWIKAILGKSPPF